MNTEEITRLETDLLAIIKEGKNLSEGEYTELQNGIRVKSNRVREFRRLCDNYYEREFNQIIENDTDTITPVYEKLTKLVEEENKDYYISKAEDFTMEVKSEIERYKALTKSFNTVEKSYNLTTKNLNDLYLKRENTPEWQQKVDELNDEVKRLAGNSEILKEQILAARKNINEVLIKYAEEQMQALIDNFTHTTKDTAKEVTMDHNFVLASDRLEYDSLYRLTLILKHANTLQDVEDLVCLDDAMIVTKDQKDVLTSTILPNIKLYNNIKKEEVEKKTPKEVNNEFIAIINKAMRVFEEQADTIGRGRRRANNGYLIMPDVRDEYNNLIKIHNYVTKANRTYDLIAPSDSLLYNVWGIAYVANEDKDNFIKWLKESKVLKEVVKKYDPDIKMREENEKVIQDLYAYLDELADRVTNYKGVANLPIKSTNMIGDKAWVVKSSDWDEANRIIEMIALLQDQTDDLTSVWGIANVRGSDIAKFKRLANATRRFGDMVPNIPANEEEINKVYEELKNLMRKADKVDKAKLDANGIVLATDRELYDLLEEKYKYLVAAKASEDLVEIDGVFIDSKYVNKYHEVNEKIRKLLSPELNLSANEAEIDRLKLRLSELKAKSSLEEKEEQEAELLQQQIDILERAKDTSNLIETNGLKFASQEDSDKFALLTEKIDKLQSVGSLDSGEKGKGVNSAQDLKKKLENNEQEIEKIKEEMAALEEKAQDYDERDLADNGKVLQKDAKKYDALADKIKYLEEAKTSNDLVEVDDLVLDRKHAEDYKKADKKSKNLSQRILSIRNPLPETAKFIKENLPTIIATGLSIAAVLYVLPKIIPALIFALSCVADAAAPEVAIYLDGFAEILAHFCNISGASLGASADVALIEAIKFLSKIAIAGLGATVAFIGGSDLIYGEDFDRLPDYKTRKGAIESLKDLMKKLTARAREQDEELEEVQVDEEKVNEQIAEQVAEILKDENSEKSPEDMSSEELEAEIQKMQERLENKNLGSWASEDLKLDIAYFQELLEKRKQCEKSAAPEDENSEKVSDGSLSQEEIDKLIDDYNEQHKEMAASEKNVLKETETSQEINPETLKRINDRVAEMQKEIAMASHTEDVAKVESLEDSVSEKVVAAAEDVRDGKIVDEVQKDESLVASPKISMEAHQIPAQVIEVPGTEEVIGQLVGAELKKESDVVDELLAKGAAGTDLTADEIGELIKGLSSSRGETFNGAETTESVGESLEDKSGQIKVSEGSLSQEEIDKLIDDYNEQQQAKEASKTLEEGAGSGALVPTEGTALETQEEIVIPGWNTTPAVVPEPEFLDVTPETKIEELETEVNRIQAEMDGMTGPGKSIDLEKLDELMNKRNELLAQIEELRGRKR